MVYATDYSKCSTLQGLAVAELILGIVYLTAVFMFVLMGHVGNWMSFLNPVLIIIAAVLIVGSSHKKISLIRIQWHLGLAIFTAIGEVGSFIMSMTAYALINNAELLAEEEHVEFPSWISPALLGLFALHGIQFILLIASSVVAGKLHCCCCTCCCGGQNPYDHSALVDNIHIQPVVIPVYKD